VGGGGGGGGGCGGVCVGGGGGGFVGWEGGGCWFGGGGGGAGVARLVKEKEYAGLQTFLPGGEKSVRVRGRRGTDEGLSKDVVGEGVEWILLWRGLASLRGI